MRYLRISHEYGAEDCISGKSLNIYSSTAPVSLNMLDILLSTVPVSSNVTKSLKLRGKIINQIGILSGINRRIVEK